MHIFLKRAVGFIHRWQRPVKRYFFNQENPAPFAKMFRNPISKHAREMIPGRFRSVPGFGSGLKFVHGADVGAGAGVATHAGGPHERSQG